MRCGRELSSSGAARFRCRLARLACGLFALAAGCGPWLASPAPAQETQIIHPGSTAVTGFSGTAIPGIDQGLPPGVDPVDETFIDTSQATLRIFDLTRLGGPATGQLVSTPLPFEVTAGQIGQVFAVTYDDGIRDGEATGIPDLYAGATSLNGIRIVTPDADGDGRPERQRRGTPGAVFMDGQFGVENGGGPGTIWKIDGISGTVTRFADIDSNSGPGIGDIAFDADHRQFFASDLDSGLIHRIDADGQAVDTFDHGFYGLTQRNLKPLQDDGSVMDIRGPAFDSDDPGTWGFTQDERRVWALAYRDHRLYYSVGERAEIWSVGITASGGFADDARWELTVQAAEDDAVTDIAFDGDGRMYLAQRGRTESRYDYSQFADSGKAEVLRYAREAPDDPATESAWVEVPDGYAVGFPDGYRQSAGGLDLQYGYDQNGDIDAGACAATLVDTGDKLRDNPALADRLAAGGPSAVHGVQITPLPLVRPQNEPPFGSWFVDFDTYFEDPAVEGHVGDVEVWRPCEGASDDQALEEALPFYPPNPGFDIGLPLCPEGRRDRTCRDREPDLKVEKRADVKHCSMAGGCAFTITVTNVGDAPYHGKIVLDEVTLPAGSVLDSGPNAPWVCAPLASPMTCTYPVTTLDPGDSLELKLGFKPAGRWQGRFLANCARYDYDASGKPVFGRTDNDRACARIPICRRGDNSRLCRPPVEKKADLILKKRARTPVCSADGVCTFIIDIINSGAETYNGPLTVVDNYPTGAPATSSFGPTPPWTCGPDGPGQFRCDNPGVVLVPGASTSIGVKAVMPAGYDKDKVTNCAEVKAIPGEADLANNQACASERFRPENPGKPALRITKTCVTTASAATASCRITVASLGTAAPSGPVRVNDAATLIGSGTPVQIQTVSTDGPEWTCDPAPAASLGCSIPGEVMTPGASRHFDVTVSANGRFENCARGSFGPAPGDDIVYPFGEACAKGGAASPIRVEKTGDSECQVGKPCAFQITVSNDGDAPFSAPMRFGDAIGVDGTGRLEGVPISALSPSFGCAEAPATLPLSCVATLSLGAHESRGFAMTVVLPEGGALAGLQGNAGGENCIGVVSPDTPVHGGAGDGGDADDSGKAYACHRFTIVKEVKKACSQGFVMNAAGNCACPPGTSFRNGQCSAGQPRKPDKPQKPEEPKLCVLLKGQVRTASGECVCPRGTELVNGACAQVAQPEPPPVRACKLLPGQVRTQDGRCVCPRGTELKGKRCAPVRTVERCDIPGQVRTKRGQCVCPRGTDLVRGACRKVEVKQCPEGTVRKGGRCVVVQRSCPKGMIGEYPDCFRRQQPQIQIDPGDLFELIPRRQRGERAPNYDQPKRRIIPGTIF